MDKAIHLILCHKWYDMIASGEKTEEYRDLNMFYTNKFFVQHEDGSSEPNKNITSVIFHRGYTKTQMKFKIDEIMIGYGKPEWGAPKKPVFIIKLGGRL